MSHETLILTVLALLAIMLFFVYRERRNLATWLDGLSRYFSPDPKLDGKVNWRIFWISFTALYVEIMLIRWIGTEVRVFAYFQNLALIACFLGFGLGCYWAGRHKSFIFSLFGIAGLVLLAEAPLRMWQNFLIVLSARLSLSPDAAMWGSGGGRGRRHVLVLAAVSVLGCNGDFSFVISHRNDSPGAMDGVLPGPRV